MLNRVRKFLKNHSPDWLNTEVNGDLLQNLSAKTSFTAPSAISERSASRTAFPQETPSPTTHEPINTNILPSPFRRGAGGEVNINPSINSLFPEKGTPHWRRIRQVYQVLETAPENATYNQLIAYVRETTGQGCSRKLISKWKKQRNISQKSQVTSHKLPDHNSHDLAEIRFAGRYSEQTTPTIAYSQTTNDLSTDCTRMGVSTWTKLILYSEFCFLFPVACSVIDSCQFNFVYLLKWLSVDRTIK